MEGRQPEPRSFHSTTAVGKRVVIMGGRGEQNQHFADLHLFDTGIIEHHYDWLLVVDIILLLPKVFHIGLVIGSRLAILD